jgi:hypothetical protein
MKKTLVGITLLLTTTAQAQIARTPKDPYDEWVDAVRTCSGIPGANLEAHGIPDDYRNLPLDGGRFLRGILPRIEERLEFCRKQHREIAATNMNSLAELLQKRDPSDVVEQILNYAFTGNEHGVENEDGHFGGRYYYPHWVFFTRESKCVYKRIYFEKVDKIKRTDDLIIDLGKYDPKLFDFREKQYRDEKVTKYEILYDGKVLSATPFPLSIERARRGWSLIYSKYCTGSQAPF